MKKSSFIVSGSVVSGQRIKSYLRTVITVSAMSAEAAIAAAKKKCRNKGKLVVTDVTLVSGYIEDWE